MHQIAVFSSSTRNDLAIEEGLTLLAGAGIAADPASAVTLAAGAAFEIAIDSETAQIASPLRSLAEARLLDVNIVPHDNRRKSLLIADMDSTIVTSETLDDMVTQTVGRALDLFDLDLEQVKRWRGNQAGTD